MSQIVVVWCSCYYRSCLKNITLTERRYARIVVFSYKSMVSCKQDKMRRKVFDFYHGYYIKPIITHCM